MTKKTTAAMEKAIRRALEQTGHFSAAQIDAYVAAILAQLEAEDE